LGTGLNYSDLFSSQSLDHLVQYPIDGIDKDNDFYQLQMEANSIESETQLTLLNIPLKIRYNILSDKIMDIYCGVGGLMSFPIHGESRITGTATYEGYYPQYHAVLFDIPGLGYVTNKAFQSESKVELGSIQFSLLAEAGVIFKFKKKFCLDIGLNYTKALNSIIETGEEDYVFSEHLGDYNSILYTRQKYSQYSVGIELGIYYKLSQ
jgi:hypothetical protein